MILKVGNVEFHHNKKAADMNTQDSNIRAMPKKAETSTDVDNDRIVKGAKVIIQTYFVWKMADRVLEKVLR